MMMDMRHGPDGWGRASDSALPWPQTEDDSGAGPVDSTASASAGVALGIAGAVDGWALGQPWPSLGIAPGQPFQWVEDAEAIARGNARLKAREARLAVLPAADHAAALLERLQGDPATVGAVDFDVVTDVYADLLIERQWAPVVWQKVSTALRRMTGMRKRYRSHLGGKMLVYDIPPGAEIPAVHDVAYELAA